MTDTFTAMVDDLRALAGAQVQVGDVAVRVDGRDLGLTLCPLGPFDPIPTARLAAFSVLDAAISRIGLSGRWLLVDGVDISVSEVQSVAPVFTLQGDLVAPPKFTVRAYAELRVMPVTTEGGP